MPHARAWTQAEIAGRLGVSQFTISQDMKNSEIGKIHNSLGENWNDKSVAEWANRMLTAFPGDVLEIKEKGGYYRNLKICDS